MSGNVRVHFVMKESFMKKVTILLHFNKRKQERIGYVELQSSYIPIN